MRRSLAELFAGFSLPTVVGIVGAIDSTAPWLASRAAEGITTSVAITVCVGEAPPRARLGLACQAKAGQRHASEADAEFLQRRAPRDRLGQALGEFIELVVHTCSFRSCCLWLFGLFVVSINLSGAGIKDSAQAKSRRH